MAAGPAGPVPAGVLALAAARAVADGRARLACCSCWSRSWPSPASSRTSPTSPDLRGNAIVPAARDLPLIFDWPTGPTWLYALTQGLHVNVGLVAIPFLLAKLWSVIPRLFAWPPVAAPAQAIERLSIALLVVERGVPVRHRA